MGDGRKAKVIGKAAIKCLGRNSSCLKKENIGGKTVHRAEEP